jgi:CheY-like chemotaxis protein
MGYKVVGSVVEVATCLADLALPDELLISDSIYAGIQPLPKGLVAVATETTNLPGFNEELVVHRLQAIVDQTQPLMKLSSVISSPAATVQVLVAEDNPDLRSAFVKVLKNAGLEVAVAINGHEVLQHLREGTPQVLILDVGLPGVSGLEVVQFVRNHTPINLTKIVLVTGNHAAAASPEADMADLVLIKPVSTRDLVSFVKRFIK